MNIKGIVSVHKDQVLRGITIILYTCNKWSVKIARGEYATTIHLTYIRKEMDLQCLGVWEHALHNLVCMASSTEVKLCSTTNQTLFGLIKL